MKIRRPAVAGQFYPEDPVALRDSIEKLLSDVPPVTVDPAMIVAGIVPHAGYVYSGFTAAHTYRILVGSKASTVVLVGPSHRDYFRPASIYDGDAYQTPLGEVAVDTELARGIATCTHGSVVSDQGHRMEHALEVQVPFIQTVLPGVQIVPITMGLQDGSSCDTLTSGLIEAMKGRDVILLASSDLSHFHAYDVAQDIDAASVDFVRTFDADGLLQALQSGHVEACGGGPMVVALKTAKALGARRSNILHTCNSGDTSGDRSSVVGYLSAILMKEKE